MDGFLFYWGGVLHLCIWSIIYDQAVFVFPLPLECEGACSRISHFPEKKNHLIQTWVLWSSRRQFLVRKWLPHENLTPEKLIITWGEVTAAMKRKTQPRYWKYHYKPQYMVLFACTEERILSSLSVVKCCFLSLPNSEVTEVARSFIS